MNNSYIDLLGRIKTNDGFEFHNATININQQNILKNITPNILKTIEVTDNTPPELISYMEYGDASYWDLIIIINGNQFDCCFPKDLNYVYSECDRLLKKYKKNMPYMVWDEKNINDQIKPQVEKNNDSKRKIKVIKKEYLSLLISKVI